MEPKQIKERILRQHSELRNLAGQVEELADRIMHGEDGLAPDLAELSETLVQQLGNHIDFEDRLLVPVIAQTDAPTAKDLQVHHKEQERDLLATIEHLRRAANNPVELARRVLRVTADLHQDMAHEEREFLTKDS